MKQFNTITSIVDTGLIISTAITGRISIAVIASGVGRPISIALSGTSLLLSLATVITRKSSKTFTVSQEKHDSINLYAQSKLDSIANIISQAMQDGDILTVKFHKVLQKVEKYRKLKADIRNRVKTDHERSARRITWTKKKRRILQVSKVSVPFKKWSSSALQHVILWSIKAIKSA